MSLGRRLWEPQFMALDSPRCDPIKVDVDGSELEGLRSGGMPIAP